MITGLKLIRWIGISPKEVLRCPLVIIDGKLCVIWQVRCADRMIEMVTLEWGLDPRHFCPSMSDLFTGAVEFDVRRGASAYHRALGIVPTVFTRKGWEKRHRMNLEIPDIAAQSIVQWRAAREVKKVDRAQHQVLAVAA